MIATGAAMTPGERLRALREAARLAQEELAERANLSQGTISSLENNHGKRTPHATWLALASALGVTVPYLVGGEEPDVDPDDPLASLQGKLALERPDVREKLRQLKIKYADRPQVYETMERRILRAWGTNIDGITDTALDDA
jgi:transcriptional regulator with XRE-family HTH domain